MSAARSTTRTLTGVGRGVLQSLRKPKTSTPTIHPGASISTAFATRSNPIAPCGNLQALNQSRNPLGSLGTRRPFSATSTVSHGHWEAPKPGEEYVVLQIGGGNIY